MTTAVVRNIDMGHFALALALGIVLLAVSLTVNVLLQWAQGGGQE
jgi:ABC-type tungstate transport system substrate-binding protein